jgi:Protein of unknown function (DUF3999)
MSKNLRAGIALATLMLAAGALAAPLPQSWRNWRYSRALQLDAAAEARLAGVVVPLEVWQRAKADLSDLRVIDDQGREVPFVLYAREGSLKTQTLSARSLEASFTPGKYTQAVLDAGEKAPFHNAVEIFTPKDDFIAWGEVAVSDDARTWRIVLERAPIFRFRKESLQGNQTLTYSESNARYIRVRILEGDERFPLDGIHVKYLIKDPAERVPVAVTWSPDALAPPQTTGWRADLGVALPVREIVFSADSPEFRRAVQVNTSNDGETWLPAAGGEIYRFRRDNTLQASLDVEAFGSWRFWRIAVVNGNDPPLAGVHPALLMTPRHIVFRQEPGRSYELLYGQSEARPPQYEMASLTSASVLRGAAAGNLGAEEVNTAYADPRPWTEQHPVSLWIALGIAVAILGYSALRALRRQT